MRCGHYGRYVPSGGGFAVRIPGGFHAEASPDDLGDGRGVGRVLAVRHQHVDDVDGDAGTGGKHHTERVCREQRSPELLDGGLAVGVLTDVVDADLVV